MYLLVGKHPSEETNRTVVLHRQKEYVSHLELLQVSNVNCKSCLINSKVLKGA